MEASLLTQVADYDAVGAYHQDAINGFANRLLDELIESIDLASASSVLDAMGGDGNLSLRLFNHCKKRGIRFPHVVTLDCSRVQCELAKTQLNSLPVRIVWGDALEMKELDSGERFPEESFDRIVIKSANHEISLSQQSRLYESLFRLLKPGGQFVNLGFLFDNEDERNEFRSIARVKDSLCGMRRAAAKRHFLLRNEFYSRLEQAGFQNIRCAKQFDYEINSAIVAREYFSGEGMSEADHAHQAAQLRAKTMRRNGRIQFLGDFSIMRCPGEITIAKKPEKQDRFSKANSQHPFDLLRHVTTHQILMRELSSFIAPGSSVFEIGSGIGIFAEQLTGFGVEYLGVDPSAELIRISQNRFRHRSNYRFETADLRVGDFGKERFDTAAFLLSLNLAGADSIEILRKVYDSLKAQGSLLLCAPTTPESFAQAERLIARQIQKDGLFADLEQSLQAIQKVFERLHPQQGNCWSPEGMMRLLQQLGFSTVQLADTQPYFGLFYLLTARK